MSEERKPKQTSSKGRMGRLLGRKGGGSAPAERESAQPAAWRQVVRGRTLVALVVMATWMAGLQARLVYLQVVRHDKYAATAEKQQQSVSRIYAGRGDILDRNGRILAYSVEAQSIFTDPRHVDDAEATAAAICAALGDCSGAERADFVAKLSGPRWHYYLRRSRQVSPEQVARVAALDLPGIGFERDTGRYYPFGSLAAHIIGWVGQDSTGQGGMEHAYNSRISGQDGLGHAKVDNRRRAVETFVDREPVPGASLELTIDLTLQHLAEQALEEGVRTSGAKAGTAIVLDPYTGELLALANYPTFNPNVANTSRLDDRINRATQYVYEPGSTFKIVTAAAALQERIVTLHELIDTNPGFVKFPGRKAITEASGRNYGVLTFEDSLVKSSNVGAIKVGLRTGIDRMSAYVERFGFGQKASRDFPGQSHGIWTARGLNDSELASVSMGYRVAVTPLQMAAAVSVVANGGLLVEPRVVRAVLRNGVREVVEPNVVRRVIDPRTADLLAGTMTEVVTRGTARSARIEGYTAAAKTGTSTRLAEGGGYSRQDYNASIVGFIPAQQPQLSILVVIDSPRTAIYGGAIAGPVFKQIAEGAMLHLGVSPTGDGQTPMIVRAGGPETHAVRRVRVSDQQPSVVRVGGRTLMPDLRGLSAREALRVLAPAGLSADISGAGFVASQVPEAGTPIDPGMVSELALQRSPSLRARGEMP